MKNKFLKWGVSISLLAFMGLSNVAIAGESTKHELTEAPKNITWVDIVIYSNETTLEDLASSYYGDVNEADFIYEANKDVIPKTKKLKKGMKLKLIVNDKYIDQPEHLGWS
jgi:hypothetical protein